MTVQSLTTATSPSAKVAFDREVAELLLRYGRMVVDRG